MSTFVCTMKEFRQAYVEFREAMCKKSSTPEQIENGHKALTLLYLGIKCTDEDMEKAATILMSATDEAMRRGWLL